MFLILIFAGGLFQSLGAATAKATFPQVEVKAFFDLMSTFLASRLDIIPEHDFKGHQ